MIKLDLKSVIESAEKIVSEKGEDFIYSPPGSSGCVYEHGGAPSCLVGHVLVDLGVPIDTFEEMIINSDTGSDEALKGLESEGIVSYSNDASRFLAILQARQDEKYSWGAALTAAKKTFEK